MLGEKDKEPTKKPQLSGFTREESDRLYTLRARFEGDSEAVRETNHRRLKFARWLYQNGKING